MYQENVQYAFYNEVKNDKDFSEFNFKFQEHESKLSDLVKYEIVKISFNAKDGKGTIKFIESFKKYIFTKINKNKKDTPENCISFVVGDPLHNCKHCNNKEFKIFLKNTIVKYKIDF